MRKWLVLWSLSIVSWHPPGISPLPTYLYPFSGALSLHRDSYIKGLCKTNTLEERMGLYTDMILYLEDPGLSLNRALELITQFWTYSGFRINWSKSLIMPLDSFLKTPEQVSRPLQWCSSFRYLGIQITYKIHVRFYIIEYCPTPQIYPVHEPMSVEGQENWIKMILQSKYYMLFTRPHYIFCNII